MRVGTTFWLLCITLVFAKASGLHQHVSTCADACDHGQYQIADHGLLFGNLHDDGEHQFADLDDDGVLLVKIEPGDGDNVVGMPFDVDARTAPPRSALQFARGPPAVAYHHQGVLPPARAPPSSPA